MFEILRPDGVSFGEYQSFLRKIFIGFCEVGEVQVKLGLLLQMETASRQMVQQILEEQGSLGLLSVEKVLKTPAEWAVLNEHAVMRMKDRNGEAWWIPSDIAM